MKLKEIFLAKDYADTKRIVKEFYLIKEYCGNHGCIDCGFHIDQKEFNGCLFKIAKMGQPNCWSPETIGEANDEIRIERNGNLKERKQIAFGKD